MQTGKILRHFFGIVALTGGLFLAACGDNTTAPTSSPTPAAATTSASTPAVTTIGATTAPVTTSTTGATPTTAGADTTPAAATTAANPTTASTSTAAGTPAAVGQSGSGKAAELLANIPNSPDYLKTLSFNNYASWRKLNNIPENSTFQSLSANKDAFARFNNTIRFMTPSQLLSPNYFQTLRDTAGFDLLQADYDVEAGQPPNLISLAQGNFDAAAIDKAWLAAKATKGTVGPNTSYTFDKLDVNNPLQRIFIGQLSLIPVPTRKLLVFGKPPEAAAKVAGELPSQSPITSNAAVKGLLDVFGDPLSIYMGTSLISSNVNIPLDVSPSAAKGALEATIKAQKPVPVPLMGGFAFYQDASGAKTYLVANYYADEASASAARPILEDSLKNGTSLSTRAPYSNYWEVASSEVKGNVLVFKLNWKQLNGLAQFVFSRDFPAFLI